MVLLELFSLNLSERKRLEKTHDRKKLSICCPEETAVFLTKSQTLDVIFYWFRQRIKEDANEHY